MKTVGNMVENLWPRSCRTMGWSLFLHLLEDIFHLYLLLQRHWEYRLWTRGMRYLSDLLVLVLWLELCDIQMHFNTRNGLSVCWEFSACLPISSHSTKIGKHFLMWGVPSPHLVSKVMHVGADRTHHKVSLWTVPTFEVSRNQEVRINLNWSL
jgi:hypothetical protein